jgi:hypothetical protein
LNIFIQINASENPAERSAHLTESEIELGAVNRYFFRKTRTNGHIPSCAEKIGEGVFR